MSVFRIALVALFLIASVLCRPSDTPLSPKEPVTKCDNSRCSQPLPNKLNVHLVPHTHDDVGWLKTVDQYFYGARSNIQKAGVQYIIDSAISSLLQNENRKFIYVETAFFWKWWILQEPALQDKVKELVNQGRLEFINGGMSMNDEAATHYNSIVDQMTWGHRLLQDTFGRCGVPKVGWQIDPFGHSKEQANLFAQMGFDGFFFARLDYADKQVRRNNKTLELIWQGSDDLGKQSDIFTHAMDMGYGPPPTFNWDLVGGGDDPFIDDPESEDYNVDQIVDRFINYAKAYSQVYATNNVLFPMGTDFQYQDANAWFKNMDKLIKYVNQRQAKGSNVNVFYSTPTCYLHGVQQANHTFTTKSDDFFPYASDPHSYWTGYFTSRPALKRYEKVGNNFLQVCKQLDVLNKLSGSQTNNEKQINYLREWMGVMQHHDAVAGTEKQHVTDNYALKLYKAIEKCKTVVNEALKKLTSKSEPKSEQLFCGNLNISACAVTEEKDNLAVTVYNPTAHSVKYLVRLPITNKAYQVLDPTGKPVKSEVVPIPPFVLSLKERVSKAKDELVFEAELPALGFATYLLKSDGLKTGAETQKIKKVSESFSVKSKTFNAMFDKNGKLNTIQLKSGKVVEIKQEFEYYKAMNGDNKKSENRASGAYVFRPDGQTPNTFNNTAVESQIVETTVGTEIHQKLNPYVSQVIRVSANEGLIEFDFVVGPIPVADKVGKEVISRFNTNLTTNGVFYTDANGRQLLKRVRNWRPTWNLTDTEPVSENYYPVNSRIAIRDEKNDVQISVLNDRSQGGGSLKDGSVELMVHRRDLHDDAFGVGEPLNEPGFDGNGLVIRGKFWLLVSSIEESAELHRDLAQKIFMEPLITFSKYSGSEEDYIKGHRTRFTGLTNELPKNIHLLTLEQWKDNQFLLRLEHFYQTKESQTLSKPTKVELKNLFQGLEVTEAVETTLTATTDKKSDKRMEFKSYSDKNRFEPQNSDFNANELSVTLNPMEIRTFIIKVKSN